ncbi:MAG TPA: hypothetical protein VNC41_04060, partial [Acidimicrobiia bacterium]|nr:hypothetical protein [Acidimicrobiia bacterium]
MNSRASVRALAPQAAPHSVSDRSPVTWTNPTVLDTTGLLGSLLEYLGGDLAPDARERAEA